MLAIVSGFSYASWVINLTQNNANVASTSCLDLAIESEQNAISLTDAYPIKDDEGRRLTPFTFTVTNNCSQDVRYNIQLETLPNTTLDRKYIKVNFQGATFLIINKPVSAEKVIASALDSYVLKNDVLAGNESKSYSLRIWLDYDSDIGSQSKTYQSKVTIRGVPLIEDDAIFALGSDVNKKMKRLAGNNSSSLTYSTPDSNITAILKSNTPPDVSQMGTNNIVSDASSREPI